ncbi:MAG: type II secretion system F family protein [Candidatus Nanohaloarchaea archaeon]|nr:type II secretion system F family protein [Candidatus Nanohaloarchaea archaeon]
MGYLDNLTKQEKVEYASFGSGAIILLIAIITFISGTKGIGGALFLAGLGVAFLPYGIYSYLRNKKYQAMEREFPGFLRNLSESRKSGMSLPKAFQNAAKTDYGRLNDDVRKAADQLSWGIPFPEVMERFQTRMGGSGLIKRSISIIMQSYEAGGDIAETMDSIAQDASKIKEAEKERKAVLQQQVFIIYAIYFLFVGILIALYYILVPLLDISGGGFIGTPPNFCRSGAEAICSLCPVLGLHPDPNAKLCYYKSIFLLMLIVEGVFNGLVAGEIGSGKVSAGLKHVMLMAPAGFIIYVGVLTIMG